MTKAFQGIGWSLPVGTDEGGIAMARHEESIRQSVWLILATAPGERVMRPDFGCGIHDLVFAVNDAGTAGRVASEVREALLLWEPRIDLIDVEVVADPGVPNRLQISIDYVVRSTNNRFNLVYPFYLN